MNHPDKDDGGYTDQVVNLLKEVKAFNFIATKEDVKQQDVKDIKRKLEDIDSLKMEKLQIALDNIDV